MMQESISDKLIKRLRYLWTWELFDSFFIPADVLFIAYLLRKPLGFFTLSGMGVLALLLWQGAAYWYLKLRSLKVQVPLSERVLRWFARLKWVNWALLALGLMIEGVRMWQLGQFALDFDFVVGLLLYGFTVLEQINYYYYQLMYDCPSDWRYLTTHRRLKRASLGRAISQM